MYVLPGNHESEADIARFCEAIRLSQLSRPVDRDRAAITSPAWAIRIRRRSTRPANTASRNWPRAWRNSPALDPLILICHAPPKSTKLDRAGEGKHFGSQAVRDFIDSTSRSTSIAATSTKPPAVEDTIGRTRGWNVGKRGQVLDLDALLK